MASPRTKQKMFYPFYVIFSIYSYFSTNDFRMLIPFRLRQMRFSIAILSILLVTACVPEGFINKVKYQDETLVNTCQSFSTDINKLIESNTLPHLLAVSTFDNSEYSYYYLEPGQYELKADSLYFRLKNDLDYPRYLDKGVAIIVQLFAEKASGEAGSPEKIGEFTIDRRYYVTYRRPYFMYRFPLRGKNLSGRKLQLSFSIAAFNADGSLKEYFCESQSKPFGPIQPACCDVKPWEGTQLQSIVEIPTLEVSPDTFVYKGFDATFDVTFQEGAFSYSDKLLAYSLQGFIEKYRALHYEVRKIDLRGYASPGGSEAANLRLSEKRAEAVFEELTNMNASRKNLRITHKGAGEDWLKVEELVTRSRALSQAQRDEVLEIVLSDRDADGKERQLKRLDYWKKLEKEIFAPARHTYVSLSFEYIGKESTLSRYPEALPLGSGKMDEVARALIKVGPYKPGMDEEDELAVLNQVLSDKASANLYAMRATYHLAKKDFDKLYADLKSAAELDPDNEVYNRILTGYKIRFAEAAGRDKMASIFDEITAQTKANPKDRSLFLNRAILLEKMGRIDEALEEYRLLFDGVKPAPTHVNNRGVARLKSNRIREAEQDFLFAIDKNSRLAEPHFNLAALYAYRGFTSRSLTYLDRAIDRDPRFKDMIFNNPVFSVVSEDPKYDKYR